MWLLPLPLPPERRIHLPPGRYLFPWYFRPAETTRLAGLLTGLLADVTRHLILPWSAARALAIAATPAAMHETLLVVTFDDPSPDDVTIDEALACIQCPHAMLQMPLAREGGYLWQERYLKQALMTLLLDHLNDEAHPLASLNIAALPVRRAASFTPDVLGLIELLEATAKHRLSRAIEGTSEADYEASLWAEVGQRLAERLLRLRPYQVEAALDVLMAKGVGAWSNERFRAGAEALQQAGLALVAGGSVNLDPMARRATDPRILAVVQEVISSQLSISLPRRWVIETAPLLDDLNAAPSTDVLMASAGGSTSAAAGPRGAPLGSTSAPSLSRRTSDQIQQWIQKGSDFNDRCRRAQDFLSDPGRSKIARTDRYSEYEVWMDPIQCEFTEEEWKKILRIHVDDHQHEEPATPAEGSTSPPLGSGSTFKGFKILEAKRFSTQEEFPRQIDAFLDRRRDLKLDLAKWMTFAFLENLVVVRRPHFLDMLSWIWRSAVEHAADHDDARREAYDVLRRCLADALKNGYRSEQEHIREDARRMELDVSGVVAAGERPPEFLQRMRDGFEKMLDGMFPDARRAYEQAGAIARERGDAFDEWVAFRGEEEAVWASIDFMDRAKQESQSLMDDYQQRRLAMERAPKVKEWMARAHELQEELAQLAIKNLIRQNRMRMASGRWGSWSAYPHEYWTMFRDLETIHASPAMQRTYARPLIDLGAFDPEEELRYRLQLGIDEVEKTKEWASRILDDGRTSLADQRKREDALLKEFTRSSTRKGERLRRIQVVPSIADIFRVNDLDWLPSFLSQCQQDLESNPWSKGEYVSALCRYAALDIRPVALDRLEACALNASSSIEHVELARELGQKLPIEPWVGLHSEAAERLVRLTLHLDRGTDTQEISILDEDLAWALFAAIRGINRFARSLTTSTRQTARGWAARLLHKELPGKRPNLRGAFNAAVHLAYLLAPDDDARDDVVKEALGRAMEGAMGVWISLVEAGVSPTSAVMMAAADDLWSKLNETWEKTLRFAENNPRYAWSQVAFLAERIHSGIAKPLSVARERLLRLVEAAPEQLSLCAEVLDPNLWGDQWQPFMDHVWKSSGGGDGRDPVAARLGAVDLLRRWVDHVPIGSAELPSELRFLVDMTLLAILDESPLVANHAAYAIVGYAGRVRSSTEIPRVVSALRRMALDPRIAVRHAAAYAGKRLSNMDVADEIRSVALEIDEALALDPYAIIQRQRVFGELDAKHPPS